MLLQFLALVSRKVTNGLIYINSSFSSTCDITDFKVGFCLYLFKIYVWVVLFVFVEGFEPCLDAQNDLSKQGFAWEACLNLGAEKKRKKVVLATG